MTVTVPKWIKYFDHYFFLLKPFFPLVILANNNSPATYLWLSFQVYTLVFLFYFHASFLFLSSLHEKAKAKLKRGTSSTKVTQLIRNQSPDSKSGHLVQIPLMFSNSPSMNSAPTVCQVWLPTAPSAVSIFALSVRL